MARQPQPNQRISGVSCHWGHLSARPARTGQGLSQHCAIPLTAGQRVLRGPP